VPEARGRDRLVEEHARYVRALAGQLREQLGAAVDLEDLVAYGLKGLVEAAARFDPRQGTRFTTFAYYRVRGAMFDGLRRMGWIKRAEYARIRGDERANAYLQTLASEAAGGDEAVAIVGRAIEDLAAIYMTSLDAAAEDRVAWGGAETAEAAADLGRAREQLQAALGVLAPRERQLIDLYYYGTHTLESAGKALGLSKSWTSRLHARAIGKLGRALGEKAAAGR
jgi:RNA polymerase sigma factor for flagellar operon FliA